jgi:uncharacterized membrane protein YdjX (TVP38/TMEM64 family)
VLAGSSGLPWQRVALAGAAGTVPPALLYAAAGAAATTALNEGLVFGAVLAVAVPGCSPRG